jgi:hypothetical protein
MEYVVGIVLGAAVVGFAIVIGFARERAFAPFLLMVVATYYILFAVIADSMPALLIESVAAGAFLVVAVAGFKRNAWLVVAGLIGHGVFDAVHRLLIQNAGVPVWWPGFCLSFDVVAGLGIAVLLTRRSPVSRAL